MTTALEGTGVLVFAVLALYLARTVSRSGDRGPRLARGPGARAEPPVPGGVIALDRLLHDANERAGAVQMRLRPLVADIATSRLRASGVEYSRRRSGVRGDLGEPLKGLLETRDDPVANPRAPGLSVDELRRLIDELERL